MNFEDAKNELKRGYVAAGVQLLDEDLESFSLKFDKVTVQITREDIASYATNRDVLTEAVAAPVECSLCSPGVREQLVRSLDPAGAQTRFLMSRQHVFKGSELQPVVLIGPASDLFVDFFRFDNSYLQLCRERVSPLFRTEPDRLTLREFLFRPATIQVSGMAEESITAAIARSTGIIEACLFSMAYTRNRPLRLVQRWPTERRALHNRPFSIIERRPGFEFPLPVVEYNEEVIRFYQLGMTTEVPELQFLGFYQVLEYFFIAVATEHLYAKLVRRLAEPTFRPTPLQLDKLIQDVVSHSQETDEVEMLKLVLQKYVGEAEITDFISKYEMHLEDKWYTKKRDRFGVDTEIKLQPGHVFGNTAKIIKVVRNALVHSSDRFERVGRHVPFTTSSEMVVKEIPLVKFLAERIILATATAAT
jgi:hypothetical protein